MSRDIKFRAWDKWAKGMIYDFGISKNMYEIIIGVDDKNCLQIKWEGENENQMPLMQFTGLFDRNGKEIYEGDIVRDRFGRIMQVKWWNYRLCWVAITETNFHHADFFDWCERDENYEQTNQTRTEVIGNIYENPELLTA
jgi:uncharacterized phage protein (TIGR01671 family)